MQVKYTPGTRRASSIKAESEASAPSDGSRDRKLNGRWLGREMSSDPFEISSEATKPSPKDSPSAIFRALWTKPPSLLTHRVRSGGWGTSRAGQDGEGAEAHVRGLTLKWVRDGADEVLRPPMLAVIIFEAAISSSKHKECETEYEEC